MILVFDTETSGLIPFKSRNIEEYPHILQLSFILFDITQQSIVYKYNKYIHVSDHVEITPFITELTGITREKCNTMGVNIVTALHEFYKAYKQCDTIVAHNISFDTKMIEVEILRNYSDLVNTIPKIVFMFQSTFQHFANIQQYCTMQMGKSVCNIMVPSKTDPAVSYKKNPKLEELYAYLFQESVPNAHDAFYDTLACLRCFVWMKHQVDIRED